MTHPIAIEVSPGSSTTMVDAVEWNGAVYLSGVVALDDARNVIGAGDPAAQAKACLDRIEKILICAGGSLDDVLRATCFATNLDAIRAYIGERNRRITHRVAATSVIVSELMVPGLVMEVEVIARSRS